MKPRSRLRLAAAAVFLTGLIGLFTYPAVAQENDSGSAADAPPLSPLAEVSIVTIAPGEPVYSMFGHTAIRIRDPLLGLDRLFNFGQSEMPFDTSFASQFLSGELRFILGVTSTNRAYRFYSEVEDRSIVEQRLALPPERIESLYRRLTENARPENRSYIYDYFFDNCATRVRDLFEAEFGDSITPPSFDVRMSFRDSIAPYLSGSPDLRFGIDLILGPSVDRIAADRELLFLPDRIFEWLATATIRDDYGSRPIVAEELTVYRSESAAGTAAEQSPDIVAIAAWVLLAVAVAATVFGSGTGTAIRMLDSLFLLISGLAGSAVIVLWLVSGYEITGFNVNLLWAWPTHLLAPFLLFGKPRPVRRKIALTYFAAASAAGILLIVLFPVLPQELPFTIVPFLAALSLRCLSRAIGARRTASESASTSLERSV